MLYFSITYPVLGQEYISYVCAYTEEQALELLSSRKYTYLSFCRSSEKHVDRLYDYSRNGLNFWKLNCIKILHQILYLQDSISVDQVLLDWRELALSDIGVIHELLHIQEGSFEDKDFQFIKKQYLQIQGMSKGFFPHLVEKL